MQNAMFVLVFDFVLHLTQSWIVEQNLLHASMSKFIKLFKYMYIVHVQCS